MYVVTTEGIKGRDFFKVSAINKMFSRSIHLFDRLTWSAKTNLRIKLAKRHLMIKIDGQN